MQTLACVSHAQATHRPTTREWTQKELHQTGPAASRQPAAVEDIRQQCSSSTWNTSSRCCCACCHSPSSVGACGQHHVLEPHSRVSHILISWQEMLHVCVLTSPSPPPSPPAVRPPFPACSVPARLWVD